MGKIKLLIDADGCPVTKRALRIAAGYGVESVIFCDTAHEFRDAGAEVVTVSKGADSADFALISRIARDDIVVTQDYGLAALALVRGARVLDQNGRRYTDENIDRLLAERALAKRIRNGGGSSGSSRLRGPAKRTEAQNEAFDAALRALFEEKQ